MKPICVRCENKLLAEIRKWEENGIRRDSDRVQRNQKERTEKF